VSFYNINSAGQAIYDSSPYTTIEGCVFDMQPATSALILTSTSLGDVVNGNNFQGPDSAPFIYLESASNTIISNNVMNLENTASGSGLLIQGTTSHSMILNN